jgi:hypothetical protein
MRRVRERPVLLCIAILTAVVLIPALLFPLPPLIDYPNHLARIWLIGGGVDTAPVNTFYYQDWRAVGSGIGIDLSAKLLTPFLSPFAVGRGLLVLAIVLPGLGAIALNARLFRGLNAWQPFFLLFWCAQTLIAGLLNFQIGLGLALLAAAAEGFVVRGWTRIGLRIAVGLLLMLIHPYALFFYALILAAIAFGPDAPAKSEVPRRLRQAAGAAAFMLVPVAVFFLRVKGIPGAEDQLSKPALFNDPMGVARAIASPFLSYDIIVDIAFALPFVGLVVWALAKRKFTLHAGLCAVGIGLAIAAVFMPSNLGHTGWIDKRFPLMALLAVLAGSRLNGQQRWMLVGAVVLIAVRTAWIGLNWNAFTPLAEAMRLALADVPAGARVLAMQHDNTGREGVFHVLGRTTATLDETYRHYPALMVPWRHAFTPMLFAQPREKPILLRADYARIANPTGGVMASVHALHNFRLLDRRTQYIRQWRKNFDYVLVLNADRPDRYGPFQPPPGLELVADTGFAQLWRITT